MIRSMERPLLATVAARRRRGAHQRGGMAQGGERGDASASKREPL
jgi:hypothetical protein